MGAPNPKNAISVLEELAAVNIIPKPEYNVRLLPTGFICDIKCGSVNVSAVGYSKKIAKHDCASLALDKLQFSINIPKTPIQCSNTETVTVNAIGKLNEMCSQNGVSYPQYTDLGWLNGNFMINCNCLKHLTVGSATTKKQAKQLAATEMLNRLSPIDFKELNSSSVISDAKVLDLFKDLRISSTHSNKIDEKLEQYALKIPYSESEISKCKDELHEQFVSLGFQYNIISFQKDPLVLFLQAVGPTGQKYTFVESGTSSECHIDLLRNALKGIEFLIN